MQRRKGNNDNWKKCRLGLKLPHNNREMIRSQLQVKPAPLLVLSGFVINSGKGVSSKDKIAYLNSVRKMELLPLPVRPTNPTFSPPATEKLTPRSTRGIPGRYLSSGHVCVFVFK